MKKLIVFSLSITFIIWSCNNKDQDSFILKGEFNEIADSTMLVLSYFTLNDNNWVEIEDTTYVVDNKFSFKGDIKELTSGYLIFENIELPLYLEPASIEVSINKNHPYHYKLVGTSVDKDNSQLQNLLSHNMIISNQIGDSIQDIFNLINLYDNPILVDSLIPIAYKFKKKLIINAEKEDSLRLNFITKHKESLITPHVIYTLARNQIINHDTILSFYNNLPKQSKISLLGQLALAKIKEVRLTLDKKKIAVGDTAPNFSRKNLQGDIIKLSNFRNKKYVLLDFWASWCGPCIKQIPILKQIQQIHGVKELQIIGISSDVEEDEWHNAINQYQLEAWPQIMGRFNLDDYFSNANDISIIYSLENIPLYILIDKQGKVIARWQHIGYEEIQFIDEALKQ